MTTIKTCRTCGREKPITEYYTHPQMGDGHLNICKECVKSNVRTRREKFPEKVRTYDMGRSNDPRRIDRKRSTVKRRRQEVDGYQAAHSALSRAVKAGTINKPSVCCLCGCVGRIEAHHHDYSKPLEVMWLCVSCHRRLHLGKTETAENIQRILGG